MILHRTRPIAVVRIGRGPARPRRKTPPAARRWRRVRQRQYPSPAPGRIHGVEGIAALQDLIVDFEPHVRLSAFLGVFVLVALWELVAPRRPLRVSRTVRWTSNIGIVVLDTVILRLVFPVAAAGTAAAVGSLGWGLFNALEWPFWLEVVLAVVVLDLVIYCQHRHVSRRARLVAAAHGASRRSRLRFDHRGPLPPLRDPAVDDHQDGRDRCARCGAAGGDSVRDRAQRHLDLQPRQCRPAVHARSFPAPGLWSLRTCTGCTTP